MKINLRSPYIVSANDINLELLKLELFVYTGVQNTDRTAAIYTLETYGEFVFEIAELSKEYLDVLFDGNFISQTVWVDYRLTKTISGVVTVGDYINLEGFYGYGYFEDGINPQNESNILQSNNKVFKPEFNKIAIPINNTNLLTITSYFSDGTSSVFDCEECNVQFDYLFQDSNDFFFQDGVNFIFKTGGDTGLINYILVNESSIVVKYVLDYGGGIIETIYVETVDECKYTPKKVTFVNKYGALQDLWFFKNTTLLLNTKETSYKNNILNFNTYSTTEHENQTLTKQGNEKLTLNSGYYPESFNEVFKQLLLSEKVWLTDNGSTLPINVGSSSLTFKSRIYDKLINYTIDFDYAFDTINKIR